MDQHKKHIRYNQRLIWEGGLYGRRLTTKSYRVGFTVPISTLQVSSKKARSVQGHHPSVTILKKLRLIFSDSLR
ncbi:hypothetical protein M413DRAFT_447120 [Hebeloma cylindrosporum]|uniref:Uncharacterized protein n=1 Tax=Hebeloma cylindrosporum TaxID=76867 RepID=A0A0C3C7X2_HEBCY|nr:hypothetical protein M413DRAFT_447120 [Hebeloma cylindrosporum h7]